MMQTVSIPLLSDTTIYKIQKLLIPAIHHVLLPKRQILYDDAWEHGEIDFLGDGRCDFPDYAKCGTYTIMDNQTGIIGFHIFHIGLVGTSAKYLACGSCGSSLVSLELRYSPQHKSCLIMQTTAICHSVFSFSSFSVSSI